MRHHPTALILVVAAVACGRTGIDDTSLDGESVVEMDAASRDSPAATDVGADGTTDSTTGAESGADAASGRDGTTPPPPPPRDASEDVIDAQLPDDAASADGAICGPSTCPQGCCNGLGQCLNPTTNLCGWAGSPCQQCSPGEICAPGGCATQVSSCDSTNCAGCCNFSNPILCLTGTFTFSCGFGGARCTECDPGQQCHPLLFDAGGFCQSNTTCDSTTCTGCCIGNVCAQGDQQNACGLGGVACQDCGQDECILGWCRCGGPNGNPCDGGSD